MWLPDWLYEAMPFVYALAGILAIFQVRTPAAFVLGALLLLAAVMIMKMRCDYRNLKDTIRLARYLSDGTQDPGA